MKAAVYHKFGTPDVLKIEERPKPVPKAGEVLIKVRAASINSWDWDLVRGRPKIYRLFLFGLFKPKYSIIGSDVAGTVEAIGKDVKDFQVGDDVFGDISPSGFGAFAEYVCAPEELLARKTKALTFEEAAALPQAGVLALQGLRYGGMGDDIDIQNVLINGAGGGVGSFAIQLAKMWGAEVTAVDSGEKFEFMRSLGADKVIDYRKENFTRSQHSYDLILDMVTEHSNAEYARVLKPSGKAVIVGGEPKYLLKAALFGKRIGNEKKVLVLAYKPKRADLLFLADLCEKKELKVCIDLLKPAKNIAEAVAHLGHGKAQGKAVITF